MVLIRLELCATHCFRLLYLFQVISFSRLKNPVLLNCSLYKRHHIFLIISQGTVCLQNPDYEMDSPAAAERYLHKQFDSLGLFPIALTSEDLQKLFI